MSQSTTLCLLQGLGHAWYMQPPRHRGSNTDADIDGVVDPAGVRTPRMYFYQGSKLRVEYSTDLNNGCTGDADCRIVLQYACEDTLTDNCGDASGSCGPGDGSPVTNDLGSARLDYESSDTIPEDNALQKITRLESRGIIGEWRFMGLLITLYIPTLNCILF